MNLTFIIVVEKSDMLIVYTRQSILYCLVNFKIIYSIGTYYVHKKNIKLHVKISNKSR